MARIECALLAIGLALVGCASPPQGERASRVLGTPAALGNGTVASYAEFDAAGAPLAIGVVFSVGALDGLPTVPSDGHHCYDANNNGAIEVGTECARWHERVLPLPSESARRADLPFKWALLNWNPHGHIPPGVYDTPHFDVHFYLEPIENVFAIQSGPCGPERVRCDQFALARQPVPAGHVPPDFKDVEAVAPAMGNHLIDVTASEFHGVPFTRTWIYGVYAGRVTFYEEMVTVKYLESRPDRCVPIKSPAVVAQSGYYPTRSCIRFDGKRSEYLVALEGFELRRAGG